MPKLCGMLTGNSGFIAQGIHLGGDYGLQRRRQVFTYELCDYKRWHRRNLPLSAKVKKHERIIRCEHPDCNRYAATLPHCWPYIDGAACDKHQEEGYHE